MSHFLKSIFQQRILFIYLILPFVLLRPLLPAASSSVSYSSRPPSPISFSRTRSLAPFPNFVREATAPPTGFAPPCFAPPPQSFVFFGPALSPYAASRQPFRAKAAPFHHRFAPFAARRDAQPDKRALCVYVVARATLSRQGAQKNHPSHLRLFYLFFLRLVIF